MKALATLDMVQEGKAPSEGLFLPCLPDSKVRAESRTGPTSCVGKECLWDVSVNSASISPPEVGSWFSFGELFFHSLPGHAVWKE